MRFECTTDNPEIVAALRAIAEEWNEEHDGYYGTPHGFRELPDGRRCGGGWYTREVAGWVACSGNEWTMTFDAAGSASVRYNGYRHGQGRIPACLLQQMAVVSYESERPDWPLWWTADMARAAGEPVPHRDDRDPAAWHVHADWLEERGLADAARIARERAAREPDVA